MTAFRQAQRTSLSPHSEAVAPEARPEPLPELAEGSAKRGEGLPQDRAPQAEKGVLLYNAPLIENQKNVAACAHERAVPIRSVDHLEHDGAFSRLRPHLVEILP